ncbi:hypothetical protein [Streptomyces sp. NPDC059994]|uniref:hypothetical protein n=1 Tax=Streptomyces sp. NPDC059994 TaxID=3347029 RepID=UPI00367DE262
MSVVEVERSQEGVRGRRALNSAMWALLIPGGTALGAAIAQHTVWVGVIVMLGFTAVAACLIGGFWHRARAATLASVSCFALMLFAGPAMYEVYMKTAGDPVPAVVTQVVDTHNRRGPAMFCTVTETGGDHTVHKVSQQQNCFGQAKVGDRVEIRKDPLGLLKPRLPDSPDQEDTTEITVAITLGLLLLTIATVFHAGQRRRDGQPLGLTRQGAAPARRR